MNREDQRPVAGDGLRDNGKTPGEQIREARRALGITQRELARLARVSIGTLHDLEQGRVARPRAETVSSLNAALRGDPGGQSPRSRGTGQPGAARGPQIAILGSLRVTVDGRELRVTEAGQRALLGLLALAASEPVSVDAVIDTLWGEKPPASATRILHGHVSRLRVILDQGHEGTTLRREASGYRLRVSGAQLDLLEFRALVTQARACAADGQVALACAHHERALTLWRGEVLCDVDVLRDHPAITLLSDERRNAILEFTRLALDYGWHARALPHLRKQAAQDRFDEGVHAALMRVLAGLGRQAEALFLYEALRRRLDQQLGVPPAKELRDAHAAIVQQRVPLARPACLMS
jgi:DNA-binding SARP family transcriptional activator/DNA-binding XRE family transcriptional regulator